MSKSNIGKRPSGCGNKSDKSCTGCGIFPSPWKITVDINSRKIRIYIVFKDMIIIK